MFFQRFLCEFTYPHTPLILSCTGNLDGNRHIIESVDSICRDSMGMQHMPIQCNACMRRNNLVLSGIRISMGCMNLVTVILR